MFNKINHAYSCGMNFIWLIDFSIFLQFFTLKPPELSIFRNKLITFIEIIITLPQK